MEDKKRYEVFCLMIEQIDKAVNLINKYDAQLHNYDGVILYQAESQLIKLIGDTPGITAVSCSEILEKTMSACSQIIKKLKSKKWIKQVRNAENNRVYNLYLTEAGKEIYDKHKVFEEFSYKRTYDLLENIGLKDMEKFIEIYKLINLGFEKDVEDSKLV